MVKIIDFLATVFVAITFVLFLALVCIALALTRGTTWLCVTLVVCTWLIVAHLYGMM